MVKNEGKNEDIFRNKKAEIIHHQHMSSYVYYWVTNYPGIL